MSRLSFHDWISFRSQVGRRLRRQSVHRRALRFEALEERQLLSITVNTLVDESDGAGAGDVSLRDAIAAAPPGETIDFAVEGTIVLTHGELTINKNLIINGPGANSLTIDADGASRVFTVDDGNAANLAGVQISGLTITGGVTGGDGGGIFNHEALTVSRSWINGNRADDGGGIANFAGTLAVVDSTVSGNTSTGASSGGGGIFNFSSGLAQTSSITNSTISGNTAATRGGGVNNFAGTLNIQFSTITNNTAPANAGSGVSSWTDTATASTNIRSSIVAGNIGSDVDIFPKTFPPAQPTFHSLGYNLIGSGDAAQFFIGAGDVKNVAASALLLGPLTNNGGPTPTHLPQQGSPAIDTGDPSAVAGAGGVPQFDQRGTSYNRVFDGDATGGARIDKGAVESDAVYFVVHSLLDTFTDSLSLREAIAAAGTVTSGTPTIVFWPAPTAGGPATIKLTNGELDIAKSMAIVGPGASLLTIDAQGASKVFNVDDGDGNTSRNVSLSGLKLTGGYNTNGGGAIFSQEQLTVSDCLISGNTAQWGGGIYNAPYGTLVVSRSTISGNHAIEPIPAALGSGGALYNWGGGVTILDSTITGNDSVTHGGGILNADGGYLAVVRSTISNNSAVGNGGGIADSDGFMNITDSTVSGNHANKGGGLMLFTPNFEVHTISNSTFSGNVAPAGGGGIYNAGGQAIVEFSTITRNVSNDFAGSGVSAGSSVVDSPISFYSTLIVANFDPLAAAQSAPYDVAVSGAENSLISLGYNVVGIGGFVNDTFDHAGDQIIGTADPHLGALSDNGGPTKTHALLAGSPAIDAGDPSAIAEVGGVPFNDQRGSGFRRVKDGDGDATATIDVGAFELQATPPALVGDYNHNNIVDAADYTVWRDSLGQHVTSYAGADGDGSGVIDAGDYNAWKVNFGHTLSPGGAAASLDARIVTAQASMFSGLPSTGAQPPPASRVLPATIRGLSLPFSKRSTAGAAASQIARAAAIESQAVDLLLDWLWAQLAGRGISSINAVRIRSAHSSGDSVGCHPAAVDLALASFAAEVTDNVL